MNIIQGVKVCLNFGKFYKCVTFLRQELEEKLKVFIDVLLIVLAPEFFFITFVGQTAFSLFVLL